MARVAVVLSVLVPAFVSLSLRAEMPGDAEVPLLKVPTITKILGGSKLDEARLDDWVRTLIDEKEKRANIELDAIKKELVEEEKERLAQERERRRREKKYQETYGEGAGRASEETEDSVRVRLDFQVPEIQSYQRVVEMLRREQALCTDAVNLLAVMDRNQDESLRESEYREAASLVAGAGVAFKGLDLDGDGMLSSSELAAAVPESGAAAVAAGRPKALEIGHRIPEIDANKDGVLDVGERKALTMAFVDGGARAEQELAAYQMLVTKLENARQTVAARFADIEVRASDNENEPKR